MTTEVQQEIMASSTALKVAKKELRSLLKKRLSEIPKESISSQSTAVLKSIQKFKPYQESKRIGIYLSMPSGEIQTDEIVRHALSNGKQVFVPYLHKAQEPSLDTPKSVMDMVDIRSISDYDSLKRDSWGIPTIGAGTVTDREHILTKGVEAFDMILMPGVAFEIDQESGFIKRLGHGKGFYDYFLHRYRDIHGSQVEPSKSPGSDALLYGLALQEQYLSLKTKPQIPVGQHDSLLHGLLVGNGKIMEGPLSEIEI